MGKKQKPSAFAERRLRIQWKRVSRFLSCLVVFGTVGSLTLPAVTLDSHQCGLQEHIHEEVCYHPETAELLCILQEHTHTEECQPQQEVELPAEETVEPTQTQAPAQTETPGEDQIPNETQPPEQTQVPDETEHTGETQAMEEPEIPGDVQPPADDEPPEETLIPIEMWMPDDSEDMFGPDSLESGQEADPMADPTEGAEEAANENPKFSVQCYAYLNVGKDPSDAGYKNTGAQWLARMVDTRDTATNGIRGNMPTNVFGNDGDSGFVATWREIYLDPTTQSFQLNYGVPIEIFSAKGYDFDSVQQNGGFEVIDHLASSPYYTLADIWILKDGKNAASINREDWEVVDVGMEEPFLTNDPAVKAQYSNAILVKEGAVIRLNHNPVVDSFNSDTTFWDYDITDGKFYNSQTFEETVGTVQPLNSPIFMRTNGFGINGTQSNLIGSGTRLAFGNMNAGNFKQHNLTWTGNGGTVTPNKANRPEGFGWPNPAYNYGCTFGLVTGLDANGNLKYASGLQVPYLFGEGAANGKTEHNGWSLDFYRNGDTYTLNRVIDNEGNVVLENLTKLRQYEENSSPSNNFWPMDYVDYWEDGVKNGMKEGHDAVFGDKNNADNRRFAPETSGGSYGTMPLGDDGKDHNSYFGMEFSVDFSVTPDYVGPMEYAFFGDDDMWVFLTKKVMGADNKLVPDYSTSRLICDIGGVHTSAGSYVDLWDWIPANSSGDYMLTVFYTERGASGSTCWINFTLPSVSYSTSRETGNIQISKDVISPTGDILTDDEQLFHFDLELYTLEGESKTEVPLAGRMFSMKVYQGDTLLTDSGNPGSVGHGATIKLKQGQRALIMGLPVDTYFRITEKRTPGYSTTVNGVDGFVAAGKIQGGALSYRFVNSPGARLPETGGIGTSPFVFGGWLLAGGSSLIYHFRRRNRRREDTA